MHTFFRSITILFSLAFALTAFAQTSDTYETYKVKKKDTVYGIAHKYNVSIDDLLKANPGAADANFNLKKGTVLNIPKTKVTTQTKPQTAEKKPATKASDDIKIGVMLPLHNNDGDGRRMLEYYRGVLMACDSLRSKGINTHVYSWNVAADKDINTFLTDQNASRCDMIFGPLYSNQVKPLAAFCKKHDIKLVIPFSITGDDVLSNPNLFQIYQSPAQFNVRVVDAFIERFGNRHIVFIDCNDTTSRKGIFTFELRKRLEAKGNKYSITNLKSSEAYFSKAFSRTQPNVVVLNTGRSPELNVAFAKLNNLRANDATVSISVFGYTEWLMYTKVYLELFHKYDVYIPTHFYYNPLNATTVGLENAYRKWFHSDMQQALPRFAITGYDHTQYFVRGLKKYGKAFVGAKWQNVYSPLQNQLRFVRAGEKGGLQNTGFMLVHYKAGGAETINY
jgi:LysM repeat protein